MDDQLRHKIEVQARKALLTNVKSDTPDVARILSLNEKEFSFIVEEIIKNQTKAVSIAFREKESIIVPAFGYFKFKPAAEKVFEEIRKTVATYGYNSIREIKDPLLRASIMTNLQPVLRQIFFDTIEFKSHKTEVLGNIFKK